MSLHGDDVCLLEVEECNLYEEEASDHAFTRSEKQSPENKTMEAEKRIRREIANSNERRRMQSINAGFQALRTLLPRHEGEKLSKAAILQQTAEYIYSLEQEKTRLLSQNCQLKRLLNQHEGGEIPLKKRKTEIHPHVPTIIPDSTDDTISNTQSPEPVAVITVSSGSQKKEADSDLRIQLDRERLLRRLLEERLHKVESLFPERREVVSDSKLKSEMVGDTDVEVESPSAPLLEAAIKAEPRVEVETLPEAVYAPTTSRQNLETIVEAIRHLEGDHLFADAEPLALTTRPPRPGVIVAKLA
ncbi:hypothetical protein ACJJTC_015722 [Scirpophaga incertulas]